jgi:hypothetical protein
VRKPKSARDTADSLGRYAGDAWSLAKRTAVGLNEIRKLINVEEKILDSNLSTTTISYSGLVSSISTFAQGLDYNARIGDSIKLQHIRVSIYAQVAAGSLSSALRIIILRDLFQQGTAPTASQILQNVGAADAINQPRNWLLRDRFSFLHDEVYELSNTAGNASYCITLDMPHEGHVKYIGSTGVAASNGFGSVYILYVSNENVNLPAIQHFSRIIFTDD